MSQSTYNSKFWAQKFNMTGMNVDYEDKVTYHTESIKDTVSRLSKTPKSVFSNGSGRIMGRADPNTIDLKNKPRKPRDLNSLVEGKYSKRMHIQGKDMYKDLEVLKNH